MAAMRGPRLHVGSAAWVAEERTSALQIVESEVEEFSYSVRNEFDWLNEHMAGIFNENETNIAETFKTPGRLRGKTPHTIRKGNLPEPRIPLSDVFGATPNGSTKRTAQRLGRMQTPPRLQPVVSKAPSSPAKSSPSRHQQFSPKPVIPEHAMQDSGYHGSQDIESMDVDFVEIEEQTQELEISPDDFDASTPALFNRSLTQPIQTEQADHNPPVSKEEQITHIVISSDAAEDPVPHEEDDVESPQKEQVATVPSTSPPRTESGSGPQPLDQPASTATEVVEEPETQDADLSEDAHSPSDGSSPIRPVVRKSSLNFASLPAREPLTAGKSIGARVSRISHLDLKRTSYYSRPTGGKSLGNYAKRDGSDDEDADEMDTEEAGHSTQRDAQDTENLATAHNKTYTQRLQDQINMLGKLQPNSGRPSKSIASLSSTQPSAPATLPTQQPQEPKSSSPRNQNNLTTPGAFPEDDDDDWIDPPATVSAETKGSSPRPTLSKSHSTDVMEGIHSAQTIGGQDFMVGETHQAPESPVLERDNTLPERPVTAHGHGKSASVSAAIATSTGKDQEGIPLKKAATVSNPLTGMASVPKPESLETQSQSPSRGFRDSPLKQVKNKLSSILKSSKGLLVSSAAISAEGKTSMLSPSTTKIVAQSNASSETVVSKPRKEPEGSEMEQDASPSRPVFKRTRSSAEREKEEKKREKEARHMVDQMDKLEKAREQEREKARVFTKEQEKLAAMEKQVAAKKENERPAVKETPKPMRTSPRRAKGNQETETKPTEYDVEMSDAPSMVAPPTVPRSVGPGQSVRNKELKRPVKPTKESQLRTKQAPTVIRVNTGSQHSQYHPSNNNMSSSLQDSTPTIPQPQTASKASKASLQPKQSLQSLKSSLSSSTGRPKALELAARKKEQDERDAQRRREAKAEIERKRAAAQEEQRKQEQQRRLEVERQRQKEREQAASQAEVKKNAQRQAAIEKAKQTRAPPPAVRSQPNGPPDYKLAGEKPGANSLSQRSDGPSGRPPSRLNSGLQDSGRPVSAVLSTASKPLAKRPLGQEANDEGQARRPPSRGGPSYQAKDAKRRRTSDEFRDELDMDNPPNIKGPPVRPSTGFKKELPPKSLFQNGYTNAPQSVTRDLFKATVTAQHTGSTKAAHPLDMAQISKGAIPFAPNPNPAGPVFKTPARPGPAHAMKSAAKSVPRSSPRFQNGDAIELPEIQTDDEDEDDEESHGTIATWVDSPDLRRALMRQETMDPSQIFGPPAPLNMEEVFSKSKDKWHKFRARTSSANWSGSDRLTEDDIRKDLAARDKMRREGGWSYEMSKEMM